MAKTRKETIKRGKKVEIAPTFTQKSKIHQTIGNCRFIYNFFISENQRIYKSLHSEKFPNEEVQVQEVVSEREELGYKAKQKRNAKYREMANSKKKEEKALGIKKSKTKTIRKKKEPKFLNYEGKTPKEYFDFLEPEKSHAYISAKKFEKWMNNEFVPKNPQYKWIKSVSSKAIKQSLENGHSAFQSFFKGEKGYPKFKKKNDQDVKSYFPKNNKTDCLVERHKIKIPTLGWVKLKEFGYINKDSKVSSITVSQKGDRYYASVLVQEEVDYSYLGKMPYSSGIGLDLGIKDFAVTNNPEISFKNINKTKEVRNLEKKLKREQRNLSRKYEMYKKTKNNVKKNKEKESLDYIGKNIEKQILIVQKLHQRLANIRENYIHQVAHELVKNRPEFITIEDLNIKGMMKNKHLSKAIAQQCFYKFKMILTSLCKKYGIELRRVDRFYPSSKLCNKCQTVKKDLKLKDRVFKCSCGHQDDRDVNAGKNLKDATKYKILVA